MQPRCRALALGCPFQLTTYDNVFLTMRFNHKCGTDNFTLFIVATILLLNLPKSLFFKSSELFVCKIHMLNEERILGLSCYICITENSTLQNDLTLKPMSFQDAKMNVTCFIKISFKS